MDQEILNRIQAMEYLVAENNRNIKSIKRYFKISLITTVIFFVLPLIASLIIIPTVLSSFASLYTGL